MSLPIPLLLFAVGGAFLTYLITFCLWTLALNKVWCGWLCPLGFLQDLLTKLREALGINATRFTWLARDGYQWVKYVLLVLMILLPMGIGNSLFGLPKFTEDLAVPFCQICLGKTLLPLFNGDISNLKIDFSSITLIIMTSLSMGIFALFFTASFLKRRYLCSYCPMAALLSLFQKYGLVSLKKDGQKCTRCGNCYRSCPMDIREIADERKKTNLVTQDCCLCMRCVEVCPENNALRATFLGLTIFPSTTEGFLTRQNKINKHTVLNHPVPPPPFKYPRKNPSPRAKGDDGPVGCQPEILK
jgi:polyferredoxin